MLAQQGKSTCPGNQTDVFFNPDILSRMLSNFWGTDAGKLLGGGGGERERERERERETHIRMIGMLVISLRG